MKVPVLIAEPMESREFARCMTTAEPKESHESARFKASISSGFKAGPDDIDAGGHWVALSEPSGSPYRRSLIRPQKVVTSLPSSAGAAADWLRP